MGRNERRAGIDWPERNSPNTVISGSFLMRPSDGCGLSQTTDECTRNSPMEISVTWWGGEEHSGGVRRGKERGGDTDYTLIDVRAAVRAPVQS